VSAPGDITRWLDRLRTGEPDALDALLKLLYQELHTLARSRMRNERAHHTLSATALVNEAYLKLSRDERIQARSRTQFLGIAARTMRRVLVDYARTRKRLKRGGGQAVHVTIESAEPFLSETEADEVLGLEEALTRLAQLQPRAAEVLEQRFFAGLTMEETAELLGVSVKTVQRDWLAARAWLRKEIRRS
jgi:RNA polymerase sigma factor (TIGR02999 family)